MTEGAHFAFYLARSDCPTLEFPVLADRNELPLFIKESLTRKEASDSFDNSFKRRIILNPFTDEELRSKLLSSTECLEEPFMHSLAAEAFKTISVKRAVKKVQEHTSDFLDWSNIEAQAANALIVEFTKGNEDLINKLKSV